MTAFIVFFLTHHADIVESDDFKLFDKRYNQTVDASRVEGNSSQPKEMRN